MTEHAAEPAAPRMVWIVKDKNNRTVKEFHWEHLAHPHAQELARAATDPTDRYYVVPGYAPSIPETKQITVAFLHAPGAWESEEIHVPYEVWWSRSQDTFETWWLTERKPAPDEYAISGVYVLSWH